MKVTFLERLHQEAIADCDLIVAIDDTLFGVAQSEDDFKNCQLANKLKKLIADS